MIGASRGSASLWRLVDAAGTAQYRRMRRPGSEARRRSAPQWLWMESVALVIAVEGSGQPQDTLFKIYGGASPVFFGPRTPWRTWGTRPVSCGFVWGSG